MVKLELEMAAQATASEFSLFENVANPVRTSIKSSDKPPKRKRRSKSKSSRLPKVDEESEIASKAPSKTVAGGAAAFFKQSLDEETVESVEAGFPKDAETGADTTTQLDDDSVMGFGGGVAAMDSERVRRELDDEKAEMLMQLSNLERQGMRLSRSFTMQDNHSDIEWELRRQRMALETSNTVDFMRSMLSLSITGIELLNNKLGPFLSLDGWSEHVTRDMDRFNQPLERVYKRVWRKGRGIHPVLQLALLLGGSAATYHVQSRLRDNRTAAPPPRKAPQRSSMPRPPMSAPRNSFTGAAASAPSSFTAAANPASVPAASTSEARPAMRRPVMPRMQQSMDSFTPMNVGGKGNVEAVSGSAADGVMSGVKTSKMSLPPYKSTATPSNGDADTLDINSIMAT